jgi:hypothetical protein
MRSLPRFGPLARPHPCVVDQLEATITANLRRAAHLRQSVLQQAFSGGSMCP